MMEPPLVIIAQLRKRKGKGGSCRSSPPPLFFSPRRSRSGRGAKMVCRERWRKKRVVGSRLALLYRDVQQYVPKKNLVRRIELTCIQECLSVLKYCRAKHQIF